MMQLAIDTRNPAEVLGAYGILALDYLHEKRITKSRFVERTALEMCGDGEFRSGVFEFEHPDFTGFLRQCCEMQITDNGEDVRVDTLKLDWFKRGGLLFANANFSKPTPTAHVQTHHRTFQKTVEQMPSPHELLTTAVDEENQHHLTAYNPAMVKSYIDRGGAAYEDSQSFYATEWLLTIALQVFRHRFETQLRSSGSIIYPVWREWLPTIGAFATIDGGHHSCEWYEAAKAKFGQKASVLKVAQQISMEHAQ